MKYSAGIASPITSYFGCDPIIAQHFGVRHHSSARPVSQPLLDSLADVDVVLDILEGRVLG